MIDPAQNGVRARLVELLNGLELERKWRPVFGPWGERISQGLHEDDHLLYATPGLDFRGKSVIDFGCNLGFYTFQILRLGASRVLGVDCDAPVIQGAELVKRMLGMDEVEFKVMDLVTDAVGESFDIGAMLHVIGKGIIATGRLHFFLDAMETVSRREMIYTLQPVCRVDRDLHCTPEELAAHYPAEFIQDGEFLHLEFVRHRFAANWRMVTPNNGSGYDPLMKVPVHFIREYR